MKPTKGQKQAIETTNRAVVVEAGAGTGKTWVLVQRFLYLLHEHPDWSLESIYAITFTEKAAREMRGRVRREVERQARLHPDDPRWRERRRNLSRLQISTIHSLCARLLRENALFAEVDPLFEVLDEQEADVLKEEAVRLAIRALNAEDHPALELLTSLQVYDLRRVMGTMLAIRGTLDPLFGDLKDPDVLLERWEKGLKDMRKALWERCIQDMPELSRALKRVTRVEIQDPNDKLADTVHRAQSGCRYFRGEDLVSAAEEWLSIDLRGGRQASWGGKEDLALLKSDLKLIREAAQTLEKSGALLEVGAEEEEVARHLQLWESLWETLTRVYDRLKEDRQALDFDDLEALAAQMLTQHPRPPRLEATRAAIQHLLVDEFQDTNQRQKQIIYALAPPEEDDLFLVGDAKQSIYRFRQADVSVFRDTADHIQRYTGHPAVQLQTSFRSHRALITALNDLFQEVLQPQGEEHAAYEAPPGPLKANRTAGEGQETPVEILLLPEEDQEGERLSAEDARLWEARWIARRLSELKTEGWKVWDKKQERYRPFRYGDAAILFRATTHFPLYEGEFKKAGLPYLTVSGRGYYDRQEVRDLIVLLKALQNPYDDLSLAAALRSPLFNLNDETLYRLRWYQKKAGREEEAIPFCEALETPPRTDQPEKVAFAGAVLGNLWDLSGRVDVWSLLKEALGQTAYAAALALHDGETGRKRVNVRKFLGMARDYGRADLAGFLRRLSDLQSREAREGEALGAEPESGAVQLMSIHAAKGLEFPVVFLADLGRSKQGGFRSPYLLHDPSFGVVCKSRDENGEWQKNAGYVWGEWMTERMEEAENKRLLYVACTRAADRLIMSGRTGNSRSWLHDIREIWDIPAVGPEREEVSLSGGACGIRIFRPREPLAAEPVVLEAGEPAPGLVDIPPLAAPLPEEKGAISAPVTRWVEQFEPAPEHGELKPAVWREEARKTRRKAPGHAVGSLVHAALAHWDCLAYEEEKLRKTLMQFLPYAGTLPRHRDDVINRGVTNLRRFKHHPLYRVINRAAERFHELRFTYQSEAGALHGVIDLLYRDPERGWTLIDWKTDILGQDQRAIMGKRYRLQMAAYAKAVEANWGISPRASLVYFYPQLRETSFSPQVIDEIWQTARDIS